MEFIATTYGFHYRITILFVARPADESKCKIFEGWSECVDWDEHTFTSTNPYTGEVYVFPIRNIASVHMEVIKDDIK